MDNPITQFLKELFPNKWETVLTEIESTKRIQRRLIGMMHGCMPYDDYALFSLNVRAVNEIIDEESAETKFEEYLDSHDADVELVDFDIACEDLPLSRFNIDYEKFMTLVNERYGWIFQYSLDGVKSNSAIVPEGNRSCDTYISCITSEIHFRWESIKSQILMKQRELIISEALAILNNKWEDITVADYNKAIEMLRSVDAYPELINVLREWIYIKGENGWKIKKSDTIEVLRLEEKATREDWNVTLQDWANLYEYDYRSNFKPENTKAGTLEAFYNKGSGLAALILGDLSFESSLGPIKREDFNDPLLKDAVPEFLEFITESLKESLVYYRNAAERGYAIGYLTQSLIYRIFGKVDMADKLEMEYKKEPYANKRASYNLLRDYKKTLEYEERTNLISNDFKDEDGEPWHEWLTPLPLSLMALDKDKCLKYIDGIFNDIKSELKIH